MQFIEDDKLPVDVVRKEYRDSTMLSAVSIAGWNQRSIRETLVQLESPCWLY